MKPQARIGVDPWDGHGNAWSAAWGAMAGAGSVLLIAGIVLLWRKPRRRDPPLLAPMDVGHNVSTFSNYITVFNTLGYA